MGHFNVCVHSVLRGMECVSPQNGRDAFALTGLVQKLIAYYA
jgi:hypothetical protein